MAEAILRADLDRRGLEDVRVGSAGLLEGGMPATPDACKVVSGLDGHVSRTLSAELVASADLVVGMAREHVREAAVLGGPGAFGRTFTLKELVRRGARTGPRLESEALADWLARVNEGRSLSEVMGSAPIDDVVDPIGGSIGRYRQTAAELESLVLDLARLIWG